MKGADPFIIAVILMAVTVTAAIAVSGWSSTLFSEQAAETRNQTDTKLSCQLASFFVRNVSVNCDNNCFTGSPYQMNATIKNTGSRDLEMSSVLVTLQDGTSYIIYGNMTSSLKGETLGKLYNSVQVSGSPKIPIQTMDLRSAYKNHTNTVGLWHFEDEGIKIADAALNNTGTMDADLNGTINGATWNTSGKYGNGLTFDGASDYVNIGNVSNIQFDIDTPFSVAFWFRLENDDTNEALVTKTPSIHGQGWYIWSWAGTDKLYFTLYNGTNQFGIASSDTVTDGVWRHAAATFDGNSNSNGMRLYINGIQVAAGGSSEMSGTILNSAVVSIGSSDATGNWMKGTMDEVTIWNRSLTGAEINSTMNSANPNNLSFENDMVGYWPFNEGSGSQANSEHFWTPGKFGNAIEFNGVDDYVEIQTTGFDNNTASLEAWIEMNRNEPADNYTILAVPSEISNGHTGLVGLWHFEENSTASNGVKDSSPSGNDGTATGSPYYNTSGRFNSAWSFDEDYIDLGDVNAVDSQTALTYVAWVDFESDTSTGGIIGKGKSGNQFHSIFRQASATMQLYIADSLTDGANHKVFFNLPSGFDESWHHVVMVFDGSLSGNTNRLKFYYDGAQQLSTSDEGTIPSQTTASSASLTIGVNQLTGANDYFNGTIDEAAIYNRALSEGEIRDLYLGGFSMHKQNDNLRFVAGNVTLIYNVSSWTGLHHVAGSYNSTTAVLYVDGTEVDSESNRALTVLGSDAYIGGLNSSFVFNGTIDEVRVSNYSRRFNTTIAVNVSHPDIKFVRLFNSTGQVNQSADQSGASTYYTEYENLKTYNEFKVEVVEANGNVIDKWYPYSEGGRCVSPSSVEKVFFSSLNCPSVADQVYGRDVHFDSCV